MTKKPINLQATKLTFGQREGVEPLPEPLALGEVSQQLRALLWQAFYESLLEYRDYNRASGNSYIGGPWRKILYDLHVKVCFQMADDFSPDFSFQRDIVRGICTNSGYVDLFNFIEFVLRNHDRVPGFDLYIASALKNARAAYTLIDGDTIVPISTREEGAVIQRAFADLAETELNGARKHLKDAGRH